MIAPGYVVSSALLGIGATAFMDVVALFKSRVLQKPSLDFALVGRWLGHMRHGRFIHRPISASAALPYERAIGWTAHYLIGIVFAAIFLALSAEGTLITVRFLPAIAFGAVTVLAPFLILQPGMGAGLAARLLPHPNAARISSLIAHLSFGLGLWVTAVCLSMVW